MSSSRFYLVKEEENEIKPSSENQEVRLSSDMDGKREVKSDDLQELRSPPDVDENPEKPEVTISSTKRVDELSHRSEFQEVGSSEKKREAGPAFESTIYPKELQIKKRNLGKSSKVVVEDEEVDELAVWPEFQEVRRSSDKKREAESPEFESTIYPKELETKKQNLGQSSEVVVVEDDEEGFTTPTSLEHKIPVILECPPAPSRKRSLPQTSTKVKISPTLCRRLQFDVSDMLEPILPTMSTIQDDNTSPEIKNNTRLDDEE